MNLELSIELERRKWFIWFCTFERNELLITIPKF